MAFYQHLLCSETQADLYQSNLQGGKPPRGWVSLSDVDNSQLYKWGRWSGWDRNKPGSKQKVLSLQTSACQKLFSKSLAEAGIQLTLTLSICCHCASSVHHPEGKAVMGSRWCLWTRCRSAVVPPTGPADSACKAPVETRAGHIHQLSTAWCVLPFPAPTSHVCFWKPPSTFTVPWSSLPGKNNLQSFVWGGEAQFSQ